MAFFAVFLLLVQLSQAQTSDFRFRHLSTGDGLSQSSVITIMQDRDGLMWFGTRDGLNKYDGDKFTIYRHNPQDSNSISNNDILKLIVDRSGNLWIGTYNGLNKYDLRHDKFTRFLNNQHDTASLSNNSVWALCEVANGKLWVGTAEGLNIYDPGEKSFKKYFNLPGDTTSLSHNYVLDIFQDSKKNIWVGTANGLSKAVFNNDGSISFENFRHNPNQNSLSDNYIQCISEDKKGNIWIGTRYGGLNKLDTKGRFHHFQQPQISHNNVRTLAIDKDNYLWIGTYNGLDRLELPTGEFVHISHKGEIPFSLSKNTIKSLFIDEKGSLWAGAYYGGINMLDETNLNFTNYKQLPNGNGLSYNVVSSIVEDPEGNLYIGTEGGGINFFDAGKNSLSVLTELRSKNKSANIKSLFLDNNENLWIGTFNSGLSIYNLNSKRLTSFVHRDDDPASLSYDGVYAILQQDDTTFWVGTFGGGLNMLNTRTSEFKSYYHDDNDPHSISSNQIRTLLKDDRGGLWIGTQYGLNYMNANDIADGDIQFHHFFFDSLKQTGEDILVIYEDHRSDIWIGTSESGLSKYDYDSKKFVSYPVFNPSEERSNIIHGILEDRNHNLWISTNHGIARFNPKDSSLVNYDESDGLVSNEYNNNVCLTSKAGKMYFGGPDGITSFDPQNLKHNHYTPEVVLTGFLIFNNPVKVKGKDGILTKAINYTSELTLDYDQSIFTIEFALPNFINPGKNLYAYRLRGLENEWNYTHENRATYTIQKPGSYVFEVKGSNNDGIWNDNIKNLTINVKPAPWRSVWAFIAYGVVIAVALYWLIKIMQSKTRLKHELELEHLEYERQQSINQMKLQFFTNVSHEFRTPLTLILGPLEQILNDYVGSNKIFKQLQVVDTNAKRLLKLINQLMDFRKFENKHEKLQSAEGNIVKFVKEIFVSFKHHAKIHNILYEFHCEREVIMLWYDRDKMERILFNLISNAFKFTPDGGTITVSLRESGGNVFISVKDTGLGIAENHLNRIFDRYYEIENAADIPKHELKKGTGIGLALAKGLIEMHKGTIAVQSKPGEGSLFEISLPLGKEHLSETEIIKDFKDSENIASYNIHEEHAPMLELDTLVLPDNASTLLIAEDNESVREFIVRLFATEYKIVEARNGAEGLKKALQTVPDLIISDVMMPEMDGTEFCTHIKSNLKTSHVPFILLTARTSLIFKYDGLESGADEYINKPFDIKELKLKVANLISSRRKLKEKFSSNTSIQPSEVTVSSLDEKLLKKAIEVVDENISNDVFDIPSFCAELGVSRTMLFTKIKAWTNLTPNEFIQSMRMQRAAQLLELNKINVSQVCYKVGFKNSKYFRKCFQKHFGHSPSEHASRFSQTQ